METDWILDEIATGLQKLYLLSLDRTPAAELLAGTAQAWCEVLTTGRVWEQVRDTPRFRDAFVTLAATRESWPAPRHFLDSIPRVVNLLAIEKEYRPASPEVVAKARAEMDAVFAELDAREAAKRAAEKVAPKREGPPLHEVEAELRQHYGTGKMAAAGPDA